MADYASEGGHFYLPSGEPFYTVIGKNGAQRAATVRDARPVGAWPGVTSVMGCADKPGLTNWLIEQHILAALTLPRIDGESNEAFLARVRSDAREQSRKARDTGTEIHGAIERHLLAKPFDPKYQPHVKAAMGQIELYCGDQQWSTEKPFAHEAGYGCKIDLHSPEYVIDFKGTEFKGKTPQLWDEHYMQLAANRRAARVDDAKCAIVFVARDEPIQAVYLEAEEAGLQRGLAMFDALLAYWWSKNGTEHYRR